jgi:hypothetical protein
VSQPFREGKSWGCGAALGLVMGVFVATDITWRWARSGVWYEWPLAIATILLCTLGAGWTVGRWGDAAVAVLLKWFS